MCLGDTPALNWLGGFKESVSKAIKLCRTCEIKNTDNKATYQIVPRSFEQHKRRLDLMKRATLKNSNFLSKKFGINGSSILIKIPNFNVCKSLLQDPMHVLYEGICHLELKCLLNEVIYNEKLFGLDFLNSKIESFKYFLKDKTDIPNIVEKNHIEDGKFCQSAGQFSTLYQNLPLMIGDKLKTNKNWLNYLKLLQIINISFSFCYDDRTISELDIVIKDYLKTFSSLYEDVNMTPKMHFLCHFPQQMKEFGPLRLHGTFRFEHKNGLIKGFDFHNFINIFKSVAYRQEYWMISKRLDSNWETRENFLSKGIVAKNLITDNVHDEGFCNRYEFVVSENTLTECDSIRILGFSYALNDFCIVKDNLDNKIKCFGKIRRMLLANNELIFKLELFNIIEFVQHTNSFKVISTSEFDYRYFKNIVHKETVNEFKIDQDTFIQVRNFFYVLQ